MNEKINEKDKIINNKKGIIDDTMNKLNKKNKDNILLQNEISNLKKRNNYIVNNNNNINNYDNNRYNNRYNNNSINNRIKKYKYDRKYYNEKNKNNNNEKLYNNNNNYFNSSSYEEKMDLKWEEIRKLNKKMDNLLLKNKNKL